MEAVRSDDGWTWRGHGVPAEVSPGEPDDSGSVGRDCGTSIRLASRTWIHLVGWTRIRLVGWAGIRRGRRDRRAREGRDGGRCRAAGGPAACDGSCGGPDERSPACEAWIMAAAGPDSQTRTPALSAPPLLNRRATTHESVKPHRNQRPTTHKRQATPEPARRPAETSKHFRTSARRSAKAPSCS